MVIFDDFFLNKFYIDIYKRMLGEFDCTVQLCG